MEKPDYLLKITDLPNDLLASILSKVGEDSHLGLVDCIFSNKQFREPSKYPVVLKNLRLDQTFPLPLERIPENLDKLYECAKHGNVYATFLRGLIEYFFLKDTKTGARSLKSAADANHPEAMYLYGMVLINENQLMEGSNYIKRLWKEKGLAAVKLCQANYRSVIFEMSIRQYREYEIWLALMDIGDGCEVGDFEEVCEECLVYKEIYQFINYMNYG